MNTKSLAVLALLALVGPSAAQVYGQVPVQDVAFAHCQRARDARHTGHVGAARAGRLRAPPGLLPRPCMRPRFGMV